MTRSTHAVARPIRAVCALLASVLAVALLAACGGKDTDAQASDRNPNYTTEPSDSFPVTLDHKFGTTTVPAEPQRIVVVGVTEQDILLELGLPPVATTEWYGEKPYAVWPWATDLLGDAKPEVLNASDGFQYEKIVALKPDLIVGTNAGMTKDDYAKLSEIAPTVASVKGSEQYFSSWQDQTRQIAKAVGRSAEGDALIDGVAQAYAKAAAAHPEFAGLSATFSQATPSDGHISVYPDGLNTDFLTDLGFTMTPGLEKYSAAAGEQAALSPENTHLMDADVIVFATEEASNVQDVLGFGTIADLDAVKQKRTVYTDGTLAGAIYFLTPLSQKYVIDKLVPRLVDAVNGEAPQDIEG